MPLSPRGLTVFPIAVRRLEVVGVEDPTPGIRRLTLAGDQLRPFTSPEGYSIGAFRSEGFDDEFKLLLPDPASGNWVIPTQKDGFLNWPRDPPALARTYTVRRWDPEAGQVTVDIVRHGTGIASGWAERCRPGDPIAIAGPKCSSPQPAGFDWLLIGGDETALPAIGRWVEEMSADTRAQVFIDVPDASHIQQLPDVPAGVRITWLVRPADAEPDANPLFDALRAAEWWPGTVFAWLAGEALALAPIRRWLRSERGLQKDALEVAGYWRRREIVAVADNPSVPDLEASGPSDAERLHELLELAPGITIRVAASLGLWSRLLQGPASAAELAADLGADAGAVRRLLRYLASLGLVSDGPSGHLLTGLGQALVEEDEDLEALRLESLASRTEFGLLGLLDALRGQAPASGGLASQLAASTGLRAEYARRGEYVARFTAVPLAAHPAFATARRIAIHGQGADAFGASQRAAHPQAQIATSASHPGLPAGISLELEPAFDVVVLCLATGDLSDPAAAMLLRQARSLLGAGGRVLLLEEALDLANADDHDFAEDLSRLATTGGALRTAEQLKLICETAGLNVATTSSIGWGSLLLELAAT